MKLLPNLLITSLLTFLSFETAAQQATTSPSTSANQSPQRDPQALAILQGAFAAMGGSVPSDSTANGTVTTVAGSRTETGSVTILTRGTNQACEQIQTPHGFTLVYSKGQASQVIDSVTTPLSSELASSSRSVAFPVPLIAAVLNNPDYVWIDTASGLPQRVSQIQRAGRGSEPRIQLDTYLSNYQKVGGVLYPFLIQKSLNGSPWMTFSIASVSFNTGLTDANFPVQ